MNSVDLLNMTRAVVMLERIKIIKCKKCTKAFTKRKHYKVHKMKHALKKMRDKIIEKSKNYYGRKSGYVKALECDECDMKFVAKSTLEAHSVLHKPFPNICECGIGFFKKKDLESHIKIVHSKEIKNSPQISANGVKKKRKLK